MVFCSGAHCAIICWSGLAKAPLPCQWSSRDSHFLLRRHSDCPISPLDTSAFVTAWIPLRPIKARPYTAFCVAASDSTSQPITCQLFAEQGQAQRCNSVVSLALVDDQTPSNTRLVRATISHQTRGLQGKGDSGLNFAQGSHRDVSAHFHRTRRDADLSQRGYPIGFVGKPPHQQNPLH